MDLLGRVYFATDFLSVEPLLVPSIASGAPVLALRRRHVFPAMTSGCCVTTCSFSDHALNLIVVQSED